jgi:hypothetical protein
MAISTFDGYVASAKQLISFTKTNSATTVAAAWHTLFDRAGNPAAGTLAVGNTAAGLVPDDTVTGYPLVNTFGGGATGYIGTVDFGCTIAARITLYDRLFNAGAYSFNSNVTLSGQPSFSARIPSSDYTGCQIWVEVVGVMTGALAVTITYTNQSGTTGRSTGAYSLPANAIAGRMFMVPLQAGDSGVQKIESVLGATATVGTFNVIILRPLWTGRIRAANDGDTHGIDRTGMPIVYDTSALTVMMAADSTSSGIPDMLIEVVNG